MIDVQRRIGAVDKGRWREKRLIAGVLQLVEIGIKNCYREAVAIPDRFQSSVSRFQWCPNL